MRNRVYLAMLSALLTFVVLVTSACQPLMLTPEPKAEPAADAPVAANGIWFEAVDVACADGNIVISDSPFIAGTSAVELDQDFAADAKDFAAVATFMPAAYPDSTWVAPGWGVDSPDGNFFVYHSGEGTGVFADSRIVFHVTQAEAMDDLPCEPVGPVAKLEGVIMSDTLEPRDVYASDYVDYDIWCENDEHVVISEEPLNQGTSEIEVTPDPEHNYFIVDAIVYPDAYPGSSWIAPGHGVNTADGGFRVIHFGNGTGDLEGWKSFQIVTPTDEIEELPCALGGPVVRSEGVNIQPLADMQ